MPGFAIMPVTTNRWLQNRRAAEDVDRTSPMDGSPASELNADRCEDYPAWLTAT
jgi:hypothetical protein